MMALKWRKKDMKSIIIKVKALLPFRRQQDKTKKEYTDLAPNDEVSNGDAYLKSLDWALNNDRIKNIALAGPYGSGKSSIIETYLKQHPKVKEKSLRISMATFVDNTVDINGTPKKIDIEQDEIEFGILKQLFYKVDYKKIPQSRYRRLHKIGWKHMWGYLIGLSAIVSLMEYIFFPEVFNSFIDKIIKAGSSIKLPSVVSLLLFGALILGLLAVGAVIYRSILSHFKVKEIKLPIDATVKSEEDSNETVFNKNMDEIFYFFEETKYRLLFFEDLDRLENSSIFVHLRELNTLLNNYNVIKEPIVFVYAVKDDIFSDTDRTKFFEFIIPVIPVINSTNSGETILEKLDASYEMNITHEISQSFVLDVSPYISDMRILQNIYNEFIIYKETLRTGQGLKLSDEPMMAMIIFKNLYPRDFADIQIERGIIKRAFIHKQNYLRLKQVAIQSKIDESIKLLDGIQFETLKNFRELKTALLCEITDWKGMARQITFNRLTIYSRDVIIDDYDMSQWGNSDRCSGNYSDWNGSGGYSFSCDRLTDIYESYVEREKRIKLIKEGRTAEEKQKVENLKLQLRQVSSWSLKRLIEQFGVEEVLPNEVRENKLLVFLLRRGYIDEKYANYINYFKGNSITKDDMNFILSVKNMEPQPFNYSLTKTHMVVQRLQIYEFGQKSIYNFDLLECMLSSDDHREKLSAFIKQLIDESDQSWKFINEFMDLTKYQSYFIKLLAIDWSNMWGCIANNAVLTYERKIHYLSLLISNVDIKEIVAMNADNEMSDFIEQNEDILQQLAYVESSKVITVIEALHVMFSKVSIENVQEDVLDYIFDNNCYELNQLMIQHVVEYKDNDLVPDLKSKNYTTIIKLRYVHLVEYVRENLSKYIEKVVLAEEHVFDAEEQIVDLLERSIDNQMLSISIIMHEEFCMEDITCCCSELITEKKIAVRSIWDTLLKNNKILSTWKNVNNYWSVFKFTQELVNYIESHTTDLVNSDCQCIGDDFIREFIGSEVANEVFETLLPHIRMNNFDISLTSVTGIKAAIMIDCKYFNFTVAYYDEIKTLFPYLCVEYILQNQIEYITMIDNIQMDSILFENLLFSERLEAEKAQILLDAYGTEYMTNRIAGDLQAMGLTINLNIFKAAWKCLDESSKLQLMMQHLELLDAEALHSCFTDLERWYSDFLDRSKQHSVELMNTPQNQKLAERLKSVDYITSCKLKEKKEYDPATETEIIKTLISCRVKAIK